MTASREKRSDDIAAVAREARERASSAVSAAEAAQKSQAASPEARADLDALTTRIAALEQSVREARPNSQRRLTADDAEGPVRHRGARAARCGGQRHAVHARNWRR